MSDRWRDVYTRVEVRWARSGYEVERYEYGAVVDEARRKARIARHGAMHRILRDRLTVHRV